ncbi:MAG TPA: APC family permease [Solirubrobacteraceae bacterium]|nr:APC family permease [Solirubrobacteraceae bacterium]
MLDGDVITPATTAGSIEQSKLRKAVGRADTLVLMLCALVGLDTLGAVSSDGAQAITWLAALALFFFVPYALLTAELGSAFPDEGGPYVWTKLAFGRLTGAVTSIFYWISNPFWLGGTLSITAVSTFSAFFIDLHGAGKYVFSLAFIWIAVGSAVLSFRVGRWIPIIGAWVRVILLGGFTLTVLAYAVEHGVHGFGASAFRPSYSVFILAAPILFFSFQGFELPSTAGGEMKNPRRDVPFAIARGAFGTVLMYGLPILAILIVLPAGQVSSLGGFIDAMKTVFTVYGGHVAANGAATLTGMGRALGDIAAAGFIWALLSSGSSWIIGADRTQAVAGYDGAAPRALGIFSTRFGTPIVVNLASGVVATAVMVLAFVLTSGNAGKYFSVVLGVTISTTAISYCAIFPALIRLRYTHPDVRRPFRVPGGLPGAWIVGGLATAWALFAAIMLVWPGLGSANPDASLPSGFAGQRVQFELSQIVPLLAIVALGVVFYALGAPTRASRQDAVESEAAAADGELKPAVPA